MPSFSVNDQPLMDGSLSFDNNQHSLVPSIRHNDLPSLKENIEGLQVGLYTYCNSFYVRLYFTSSIVTAALCRNTSLTISHVSYSRKVVV